jgi:hypothetical protein
VRRFLCRFLLFVMHIEEISRLRPWGQEATTRRRIAFFIASGIAATLFAAWQVSSRHLQKSLDADVPVVVLERVVVTGERARAPARVASGPAAVHR